MLRFVAYHPDVDYIAYQEDQPGYQAIPVAALIYKTTGKAITFVLYYN